MFNVSFSLDDYTIKMFGIITILVSKVKIKPLANSNLINNKQESKETASSSKQKSRNGLVRKHKTNYS